MDSQVLRDFIQSYNIRVDMPEIKTEKDFTDAFTYNEEEYTALEGASKICLLFKDDPNYVLKVGLSSCESDYCAREKEVYDTAKEEGLEQCFAAEECFDTVNDYDVYIQERGVVLDDIEESEGKEEGSTSRHRTSLTKEQEDYAKNSLKKCYQMSKYDQIYNFDHAWVYDFITYHGEETLYQLMNFLAQEDINDLHSGNYGYVGDRPCLIDYSGYYFD